MGGRSTPNSRRLRSRKVQEVIMILETRINIQELRNMVDAAASLQEAGRIEAAKKILMDMANAIVKEMSSPS